MKIHRLRTSRSAAALPNVHFPPVARRRDPWSRRLAFVVKFWFDVAVAAALLIVLSPLLVLVSVLISLESPGGAFFVQPRIGRNGRVFQILKFRTMSREAPKLREQLLPQGGPTRLVFKIKGDPRVTRLGRLLRKFSVDEFPQLVNVVRGDMSLVGPRPLLLEDFQNTPPETPDYERWYVERHRFRPGISGLWQVSGRNQLPFEKLMELDLRYVRDWSLSLDMEILLRTPAAVLAGAD